MYDLIIVGGGPGGVAAGVYAVVPPRRDSHEPERCRELRNGKTPVFPTPFPRRIIFIRSNDI